MEILKVLTISRPFIQMVEVHTEEQTGVKFAMVRFFFINKIHVTRDKKLVFFSSELECERVSVTEH